MGRIGSHVALFPLAGGRFGLNGLYPAPAFAFPSIPDYTKLRIQRKSDLLNSLQRDSTCSGRTKRLTMLDPLKHNIDMNRLDSKTRAAVISALVEGCSIRSTVRMTGVSKRCAMRLLVEEGPWHRGIRIRSSAT